MVDVAGVLFKTLMILSMSGMSMFACPCPHLLLYIFTNVAINKIHNIYDYITSYSRYVKLLH